MAITDVSFVVRHSRHVPLLGERIGQEEFDHLAPGVVETASSLPPFAPGGGRIREVFIPFHAIPGGKGRGIFSGAAFDAPGDALGGLLLLLLLFVFSEFAFLGGGGEVVAFQEDAVSPEETAQVDGHIFSSSHWEKNVFAEFDSGFEVHF